MQPRNGRHECWPRRIRTTTSAFLECKVCLSFLGFYRGYIGIMEKKLETTIMGLYRGYIGMMETKMETAIMGFYRGYIVIWV